MDSLTQNLFFSLKDYAHPELWSECDFVWEALNNIKKYLLLKKLGTIACAIPEGAHLVFPELISIGEGTVVEPGAYIQGPCIIGPNSQIRHGAYIRGNVITGQGCIIGHDTEVKHSILLDNVSAAHFNYVGDSILGNGVNLGAGVKCANFRLDKGFITVAFQGKRLDTGLKKFGAILGDNVQLGCNCVTNPGTLLAKGVVCYPCLNIGGYIASDVKTIHITDRCY
ncbi:MAG: UDP-N-acetylglucosamine diphosphorylase [Chlamydiota bacterium]